MVVSVSVLRNRKWSFLMNYAMRLHVNTKLSLLINLQPFSDPFSDRKWAGNALQKRNFSIKRLIKVLEEIKHGFIPRLLDGNEPEVTSKFSSGFYLGSFSGWSWSFSWPSFPRISEGLSSGFISMFQKSNSRFALISSSNSSSPSSSEPDISEFIWKKAQKRSLLVRSVLEGIWMIRSHDLIKRGNELQSLS